MLRILSWQTVFHVVQFSVEPIIYSFESQTCITYDQGHIFIDRPVGRARPWQPTRPGSVPWRQTKTPASQE
jgi:hypothetical protein